MIKNYGLLVSKDLEFPDHYRYKENDIKEIINLSEKMNSKIITTEKDYLRLGNLKLDKIKYIKSDLQIDDEDKLINSLKKIYEKN
jgi:tetraacyldisaccharide 4'-kinase